MCAAQLGPAPESWSSPSRTRARSDVERRWCQDSQIDIMYWPKINDVELNDVHGPLNEMSIFGLKLEFAGYKLGK